MVEEGGVVEEGVVEEGGADSQLVLKSSLFCSDPSHTAWLGAQ